MAATFDSPSWLAIPAALYKRALNRQAVSISKWLRKRGAAVPVKAVMDAIHAAYHRCDGLDPYDGMPLQGALLADYIKGELKPSGVEPDGRWDRLPAVGTAHPSKFNDVLSPLIGEQILLPSGLQALVEKPPKFETLPNEFEKVKEALLKEL